MLNTLALLLAASMSVPASANTSAPAAPEAAPERVRFTLREMRISAQGLPPGKALTLKAGRRYALTFENAGQLQHDVALGRGRKQTPDGPRFAENLLAGVEAELVFRDSAGREAAVEGAGFEPRGVAEHELGLHAGFEELELDPGATLTLLLTLPDSAAGEWQAACFMPGHESAGMRMPLRVLPSSVSAAR
jgi:uncharacterized cupredoxin-like copper-binding protein